MSHDPGMVQTLREQLTRFDVRELRTAPEVDDFMQRREGTALIVVNSVCGCAGAIARASVGRALDHRARPDRIGTVFAGEDLEATERARSYFGGNPPSSPSFALFKEGRLVHFVPRQHIERSDEENVTADLVHAFEEHCATP